jgi:hypothetical protein
MFGNGVFGTSDVLDMDVSGRVGCVRTRNVLDLDVGCFMSEVDTIRYRYDRNFF